MKSGPNSHAMLIVVILLSLLPRFATAADKKQVLQQANRSLYNLRANGLLEFSCQALPNFDAAYKDIKMDEVGRTQVLPAAKKLRFQVAVGPSGAANVSHEFTEAPASQEISNRLQQIAGGMEQIIHGFFQTWSTLTVNTLFSASPDEYQLDEVPDGYRVTADASSTHVEILLDHAYIPLAISARTSTFDGTVHPRFAKRADQWLLQSYDGTYKTNGGVPQTLSMKIEYQELERLAIPRTIEAVMTLPQGRIDAPITLSNCQVKKRQ